MLLDEKGGSLGLIVDPADRRYSWDGRVDFRDPTAPVMAWSGAAVGARFRGSAITVRMGKADGQNWFNLIVDGNIFILFALTDARHDYTLREGLGPGEHSVLLFKRSEAAAGKVAFLGFSVPDGELLEPPPAPSRRLEFLGDSITAGACDEDGPLDQWVDRSTHNFYGSYAAVAARELGAGLVATAVSGMGVSTGWYPLVASQAWDRANLDEGAPLAPPASPEPDAVIVNLGENDDSVTKSTARRFPEDFSARYVELIRGLRSRYPRALIVCALGGMEGGHGSLPLGAAWQAAVNELEASDPRIHHFRFQTVSELHPRTPAHRAMAAELVAFLKKELGW